MVAQPAEVTPRFTVIVPPDRPDVQAELAQELLGEAVEVILERRREERRPQSPAAEVDEHQLAFPVGDANPPLMCIVSRQAPGQFQFVGRHFADEREIQVLYDRRHGDRRAARLSPSACGGERRQEDRRRMDTDQDLRTVGWALVRVEAAA